MGQVGVGFLQVTLHLPMLLPGTDLESPMKKCIHSSKETPELCLPSPLRSDLPPHSLPVTAQPSESTLHIFCHHETCDIKIKNVTTG